MLSEAKHLGLSGLQILSTQKKSETLRAAQNDRRENNTRFNAATV